MKVAAFDVADDLPHLREPCALAMLTPWVNVGKVGRLVLGKIERHLGAKELGRLTRPGDFFDFTRDRPVMRSVEGVRTLSIPNTIVNYALDPSGHRDYIFLHIREPHARGEDYTDAIVELLQHFGASEYCRIGGFYDAVPHTRPLLVTGTISDEQKALAGSLLSPRASTYQGPTSIVNLVTENMEAAGATAGSLMVHVPQYAQLDEDHNAAARVLEILCAIYGFPTSLVDFTRGEQQYKYISSLVQNNPQVTRVIEQLETDYDKTDAGQSDPAESSGEQVELAPDVESFLQQMGQRLEENSEDR